VSLVLSTLVEASRMYDDAGISNSISVDTDIHIHIVHDVKSSQVEQWHQVLTLREPLSTSE
jgi:hypothetical protein